MYIPQSVALCICRGVERERERHDECSSLLSRSGRTRKSCRRYTRIIYAYTYIRTRAKPLRARYAFTYRYILYTRIYIRLFVVHFRSWNINFGVIIYALNPPTSAFNAVYIYNIHYYAIHLSYVLYPRK